MTEQTAERMSRLYEAGLHGFWAVNVNLMTKEGWNDLLRSHEQPGTIVRLEDVNAIRFVPTDTKSLEGCIAGWISEDEPQNGPGPGWTLNEQGAWEERRSKVDASRGAHG